VWGILSSCQEDLPLTIEVASSVPQTIEVTRIVQQPIQPLESKVTTATAEPAPSVTTQVCDSSVQIEPAYFDGIVVLTQYYTLLSHGLYEESYQLLSSSQQKRYGFEDYKSFYSHDLKALVIEGIQPYNHWRVYQGLPTLQIPPNKLRYVVFMTAYHNGAAWNQGGTPVPDDVTGFQTLVLENSEWKIDEFSTSP
jgi:hypothetical protein